MDPGPGACVWDFFSDVLGPGPKPETRRPDRVFGQPEKARTRHSRPETRNLYALNGKTVLVRLQILTTAGVKLHDFAKKNIVTHFIFFRLKI